QRPQTSRAALSRETSSETAVARRWARQPARAVRALYPAKPQVAIGALGAAGLEARPRVNEDVVDPHAGAGFAALDADPDGDDPPAAALELVLGSQLDALDQLNT